LADREKKKYYEEMSDEWFVFFAFELYIKYDFYV
jgi:hypothetical protein